jgi:hypothetical protein
LELLQTIQTSRPTTAPSRSLALGHQVTKSSYSNVATQVQCLLCNGPHRLFKCDKFLKLQPEQRHTQAKQLRLCFNCLQAFTKDHTCSKQMCRHCHKKHHTLLHVDKQSQTNNDKESTTSSNQSLNAEIITLIVHSKVNQSHFACSSYCGSQEQVWSIYSMQNTVRQCLSSTLHHRKMCTTFEVTQGSDVCIYSGHW